ncbi:MAG: hypothetical protein HYU97_02235 [Deltaproteobacteria bacterium]|nr:hypothetical protein [Deltaproteobacteria bacterium]
MRAQLVFFLLGAIGDKKHCHLGQIQKRHWEQTAKTVAFPTQNLEHLLEDLQERGRHLEDAVSDFNKLLPAQLITTTLAQIKKQLSKLLQ